jgi:hypothetical protein
MDLPPILLPPHIDDRQPPTDEQWKYKKVVHRWRTEWIPIDRVPSMTPTPPSMENTVNVK